jgi:hypothetical protein
MEVSQFEAETDGRRDQTSDFAISQQDRLLGSAGDADH